MDNPGRGQLSGNVFEIRRPQRCTLPLVLASPHSGAEYPDEFLAASRLDPLTLRRSEDSFVDEIFASVPDLGAPLVAARFPRAYLDVNREPWELDPTMFMDALPNYINIRSPRVRMGLGTIARVVASGEEIYARKLRFADARTRIETLYHPYHQALSHLVLDTEAAFGGCLLIDCYSMSLAARGAGGQSPADIVLGDCHGTSCASEIVRAAQSFLTRRNFAVALNTPYAGGFTTAHYGNPRRGRHAVQIEINRALYMDERRCRRKPPLPRTTAAVTALVAHFAASVGACLGEAPR